MILVIFYHIWGIWIRKGKNIINIANFRRFHLFAYSGFKSWISLRKYTVIFIYLIWLKSILLKINNFWIRILKCLENWVCSFAGGEYCKLGLVEAEKLGRIFCEFKHSQVFLMSLLIIFTEVGYSQSMVCSLVRDDVEMPFFAQNQQKPYKFFSQIVHF